MNALETSFASCRSWQDSTTQEWSSSLPSEDYTFCVGAAHDTAERNPRGKTDLCKPSHASCTRQEGVTLGWTSCPPKACSSHFGAPFSTADTSGYVDTQGRSYASWVPQETRLFPEGILRTSGEHNSLSGTASLSAQQQALLVQAMLDTRQASHPQCIQKLFAAEQGEEVHSFDQTWGWNPIASPPGFLCMQHSRVEMSVSNLHPLLGVMASLLDNVASDYVFGAMNTIGRPRGYITLETICEMDDDKQLSTVQHHRWLQFLQVWENAGWGCSDVILLTEELRPLQYGHPRPQAQTSKVGANQMLKCISSYGNSQGHRRFKLKESLIRFLNVVQQNFSSPGTVLLRDPDVNARLSKVQVNGHFVVAEDIAPV